PKSNSNIISFVNAVELKKEHMVKLPVIVYNHHRKEEVISSALHLQRQLELLAQEEEKQKGKYIRPIILFQAQSNIKGKDNTTFQNIKEKLIRLGIPEEQIKIKVSGIDELKGIDLTSKDCPVRYIITINALKEGWDCPNAYILASLADKSSAVDVEQILGRILRQPYVTQHSKTLLNLSFVLTASAKFKETLDKIVKGLQDSGFSKDDYYATDTQQEEELTDNDILKQELLSVDTPETTSSDDDFAIEKIEYIPLNDNGIVSKVTDNSIVQQITEKAITEGKEFEQKLTNTDEDDDTYLIQAMGGTVKTYKINEEYIAGNMKLPQFFKKSPVEDLNAILFKELKENEIFLSKNSLLEGFVLATQDTQIDFKISADIYKTDIDERTGTVKTEKIVTRGKELLLNAILNTPKEGQIRQISSLIVRKLGDQSPISQQDLTKYVNKIFENITNTEQIRDIVTNVYIYIAKIKEKINKLTDVYSRESFNRLLDTNQIITKESWSFPKQVNLVEPSSPIIKSLYEQEEKMNQSEHKLIMEVAALENVKFWHRNLERKKGFFLNGYNKNHYPDFIICTEKNNLILLEVKGDHLNNEDSKNKNLLGKKWAEKAGEKYKYFMAFESVQVPDTYTFRTITEVIKSL
uniref:restriction endonuclease n=1 Tax=Apibacter mensalis TaxID=1586267 RepID=UPI0026F2D19B